MCHRQKGQMVDTKLLEKGETSNRECAKENMQREPPVLEVNGPRKKVEAPPISLTEHVIHIHRLKSVVSR